MAVGRPRGDQGIASGLGADGSWRAKRGDSGSQRVSAAPCGRTLTRTRAFANFFFRGKFVAFINVISSDFER